MNISVIGAGSCNSENYNIARQVGRLIAEKGAIIITGGLSGVMEAAARGAKEAGGVTVGILPGSAREEANPYIDIPVVTGISHARNIIVVRSGEAVIAFAGEYGTLSEIAIALKLGKPVVGVNAWENIKGLIKVSSAEEAVNEAFKLAGKAK